MAAAITVRDAKIFNQDSLPILKQQDGPGQGLPNRAARWSGAARPRPPP
jgi:hypothetical protein